MPRAHRLLIFPEPSHQNDRVVPILVANMPVKIRESRWSCVHVKCVVLCWVKSHDSSTQSERLDLETFSIRKVQLFYPILAAKIILDYHETIGCVALCFLID